MTRKKQSRSTSYIFRIILAIILVISLVSLCNLQKKLTDSRRELSQLQQISNEKQIRVNELLNLLDTGTEADYIEKAAREKLGYVYSDEQIYVDLSGN